MRTAPLVSPGKLLAPCLALTLASLGCAEQPLAPVRPQAVVIAFWDHARPTDGRAFGVDVDDVVSTSRTERCDDVTDDVHVETGEPGIDDRFGARLLEVLESEPGLLSRAISEDITGSGTVYGLRIEAADGAGRVEVSLLALSVAPPSSLDARGRLPSLSVASETVIARALASRTSRGLTARFARWPLPMGAVLGTHELSDVRLDLLLDGDGRVIRGDVGGAIPITTVLNVAHLMGSVAAGLDDDFIVALAGPDLRPDADGAHCDAVSIGVGLELSPYEPRGAR